MSEANNHVSHTLFVFLVWTIEQGKCVLECGFVEN